MKEKEFYFKDPYCFWKDYQRILFRACFYSFVSLGIIFPLFFIFFNIPFLKEISPFLLMFFFYLLVKKFFPEAYLNKLRSKKKINISYYCTPLLKELIIEATNYRYLDAPKALLMVLLKSPLIQKALARLEVPESKIKEIQKEILSFSENNQENFALSLEQYLNEIAPLLIKNAQILNLNYLNEEVFFLTLIKKEKELEDIFSNYKISSNDFEIVFKLNRLKNKPSRVTVLKGLSTIERSVFREKEKIKVNPSLTSRPTPLLNKYGLDFTELSQFLKIGIMVGHKEEYQRLINILTREGKRNVLLIGTEGIGKETIVSFLAYNIIRDNVPSPLKYHRLVCFSLSSFLSTGNDYVSLFNILKKIVEEIILNKELIIYFKDFYLFQVFAAESGFSALEVLRPLFESPFVKVIADSPLSEYHRYLENHPLIKENFEIIEVQQVTSNEALEILAFKALELERKKRIIISYKAIKRAIFLAERFFKNIPLPGSAESILTETIEGVKRENKNIVEENDILNLVSQKTEVPLTISTQEEKEILLNLEKLIHEYLINQEEAVQLVASYLRQYRAGLAETKKPIGVFLFVGPTGVGKTELAKTLARVYFGSEKSMIRFDMNAYQDQRSIFRFIGDPEGKIEGELTEAIKRNPYTLILLDEFEKAHPKVLELFLQVFDEGYLKDNFSQIIDFTNTIIIATSNARSDYLRDQLQKEIPYETIKEDFKKVLLEYFKPELLNRFDEIIIFKPLSRKNIQEIVKLKLESFKKQLKENQSIEIDFEESVIKKIAQLGYNNILGARPLNSVIRKFIKDPLAKIILSFKEKPKKVSFTLENEKIKIHYI